MSEAQRVAPTPLDTASHARAESTPGTSMATEPQAPMDAEPQGPNDTDPQAPNDTEPQAPIDWTALAPPTEEELIVVVGPTASGKTELAVRLAERFGGEVISADSVQIYRAFDVGSGKPSAEERARAPHHLIDVLDPLDPADAQRFASLASEALADIRKRGRVPIVCGGTFLWVKALVWGLSPAPPADPEIRARHQALAAHAGRQALHAQLAQVDAESAARLAPNDLVRVSRALEIYELTGRPQSVWHAAHGFQERRHVARLVGVHREREELDRRIAARVRGFLNDGWIEEVRVLVARGYGGARAMGSVGYKQVREHVDGQLPAEALEEAAVRATRVFVRRQRTWLRDLGVTYLRS
ncbi:tRNA (adenosine(37)-N6)-dimethylallyltransferase MiaA [Chondromyces crocatus]|uniref:tRNA dimethylallyltransferase n=1 Tax=Chondromyces crocatus TaxID=52 RepID=A0A0K1E6X2_CHOCO|nr:tRNA (adenosine(37)-N6)-dimethylallyltransferase MiaA [Chondromyces crocatus]AKT36328.1 tRNA dimethylallyltransferase [Chondromyces crocatus]